MVFWEGTTAVQILRYETAVFVPRGKFTTVFWGGTNTAVYYIYRGILYIPRYLYHGTVVIIPPQNTVVPDAAVLPR
jgi:hypothetical protein